VRGEDGPSQGSGIDSNGVATAAGAGGPGDLRNWQSALRQRGAVGIDLAAARVGARQERMKANRAAACGICAGGRDFGALQLQRAECRMS